MSSINIEEMINTLFIKSKMVVLCKIKGCGKIA